MPPCWSTRRFGLLWSAFVLDWGDWGLGFNIQLVVQPGLSINVGPFYLCASRPPSMTRDNTTFFGAGLRGADDPQSVEEELP